LEALLTHRPGQRCLAELQQNEHRVVLTCAVIRLAANLAVVLACATIFVDTKLSIQELLWAFVISTALLSLFAVAVPFAWAKYAAEPYLATALPVLWLARRVMTPVLWVMHVVDVFVRRLMGVSLDVDDETPAEREILEAVHEGVEEGVVDTEERKMIEAVIEQRSTTAGQVMTPRTDLIAFDVGADLEEIKRLIEQHGYSRMPVYEEHLDNIVGMLYVKDLLGLLGRPLPADFSVRGLIRQCYFVPEGKSLRDLFAEFRARKLHIAVVLDEYGGTLGVVTLEDIVEEIVGDITDEYEQPEAPLVQRIDINMLELDGKTRVDELNEEYQLRLPEKDDYETIAGFLFSRLGRIPATRETLTYENLKFTILDATERKINRIQLEILPGPGATMVTKD